MGLLRFLATVAPSDGGGRSPDDDFWYQSVGPYTSSGVRVSEASAMRLAAVYSCVRVIAETLATMPLSVFQRMPNGSRREATEHPIYKLFHRSPNPYQTTLEFRETIQIHLELRGNAYCFIMSGPSGPFDQLIPIHPDRVTVKLLPNGRLSYLVRQSDSTSKAYTQDEILHFKGMSSDGIVGMSTIGVQADTIGLGIAAAEYGARFLQNDGTPPGILKIPKSLKAEQKEDIRQVFQRNQTSGSRGKVLVVDGEMDYTPISLKNTDAQYIESRKFSRAEICGFYRVPPHMISDLDRATHSNIEHQGIEFVQYCMGPRASRFEATTDARLVQPLSAMYPGDYFVSIDFDSLMRGDLPSRYAAYGQGRNGGWLSSNDIRRKENMSPIGSKGDIYLQPVNYAEAGMMPSTVPTADDDGSSDLADGNEDKKQADGAEDDDSE